MSFNRRNYSKDAFIYIEKMAEKEITDWNTGKINYIQEYAGRLGISAGAIAGALVEEADSYYTECTIKGLLDKPLDDLTAVTLHEDIKKDYEYIVNNNMIDEKTGIKGRWNTFYHPAMRDIGPCNIRVAVAIRAVLEYFAQFPDNPLNLSEDYKTNYQLLVADIASENGSKLTVAIAAIELKKAQDYFEKNVDKDYWAMLPQETRDALIITAYNNGLAKIEKGRQSSLKAFGTYKPIPGGGESGGLDHENNAERIAAVVGQENYGNRFSISLLEMKPETVISKAMQNDAEGQAYRYALLNQNKAAILGIDYSAFDVAANDFSQSYWQDRLVMLQSLNVYANSSRNDRIASAPYGIPFGSWGDVYFYDLNNKLDITFNGTDLGIAETHKIIFGTNGDDKLIGGSVDDRLYGGQGNDILIGDGGYNRLEGGQGKDSYYIKNDGEADTIYDSGQLGEIFVDGIKVGGIFTSKEDSPAYYSEDGKFKLNALSDGRYVLSIQDKDDSFKEVA